MELSSILTNARSSNLVIRQEAESIITQLSDNSYDEILFNLTIELSNNNSVIENRLLAATLIKNLIGVISKYEGKYLSLNSLESKIIVIKRGIPLKNMPTIRAQ